MLMKQQKQNGKQLGKRFQIRFNFQTIFFILLSVFFILSFIPAGLDKQSKKNTPEKAISQVLTDVKQGKIKKLEVADTEIKAYYKNSDVVATAGKESNSNIFTLLKDAGINPLSVQIQTKNFDQMAFWINVFVNSVPYVLMIAFFIYLFRQARGAQDSIFSFGQSRAKRFQKGTSRITFNDVAGIKEAKEELQEVVDFLKFPDKYTRLGARTPKGVLLVGPAGCGKTLLAKAIAGEANVPFYSIAGSEFMEMLVGIGAARVRDLFKTAKLNAPAIIFIDEIDAIGRARSTGLVGGHDEREQTLNQILVEMDGFEPTQKVVVIGATNRGDLLDSALMRPGRFDRRITVSYPDIEEREAILKLHAKGKPFDGSVQWDRIAKRTVGYSGADLENMLNEAAILAARQNKTSIDAEMVEEAATKVKLGPEKKRVQTEADKKITAYHEAGHAIVSYAMPHMDPVHRISIVARGMSLGHTLIPPIHDLIHETKTRLIEQIATILGGRAAEELMFNEATTGAANDFNQATAIARAMVTNYGMSALGPIAINDMMDITSWIHGGESQVSQELLAKIDKEVARILNDGYTQAKKTLAKHKAKLTAVAQALLKKENLDQEAFETIMKIRA
ncbi:cell division protein FtsH [Candidatus Roizmanbacteria bacterium CG10_big_fil_rev_8_21_14_0_10_45_7]|uniref:ATP-dependent zinc metalloprotease FtsH n=1 Tax=Candidatus Roizmanbacteria bacterium CG10_big_fil_rev_8_21_14_0_10_45_7 TaxID=1974854 RepID=A0A2M8KV51_9BACT|nr:MAG: cell division protein FtsH [Candidatus Roizmanbacteria bacterium CG10_big_fil_rev_8_21_14_0_10_45_7]